MARGSSITPPQRLTFIASPHPNREVVQTAAWRMCLMLPVASLSVLYGSCDSSQGLQAVEDPPFIRGIGRDKGRITTLKVNSAGLSQDLAVFGQLPFVDLFEYDEVPRDI